jgi:hypothetical protein
MPPVHRFHHGPITIPVALIDAIDHLFAVTDGDTAEFGLADSEGAQLAALCTIDRGGEDAVNTDASVLSAARNVCDTYTLNSWCDGDDDGECGECMWCDALILRDWCDLVLDRAGHLPANAHLAVTPDDYRPDLEYLARNDLVGAAS